MSGLGGHAYTIPAADCYANIMGGPADGTGAVLSFDAAACYGAVDQAEIMVNGAFELVQAFESGPTDFTSQLLNWGLK